MDVATLLGILIIAKWFFIAHLIERFFYKLYHETTGDYVRREWFGKINSDARTKAGD